MKQDGLLYFTDTYLTAVGLLIFFMFFVGVVIWVNRKQGKTYYKRMEQIPLNDEELAYERI